MIRRVNKKDLPEVLNIYEYARRFMVETGNPTQWGATYPAETDVINDIEAGKLYAVDEEGIIGVFFFEIGEDPTYDVIEEGDWISEAPYGTIHRVAGNGKGSGVLRKAVEYCWKEIPHLRIDTHEDNKIMQHAIEKNGFQKCGIIFTRDGSPRIVYEKVG